MPDKGEKQDDQGRERSAVSPTALLSSRRWNLALFTTYALSLTFFESVVLRILRQSGCREIWVVVDAKGYRASLMERRSSRVGQEYRLVPVALPTGVFHPKCTYLSGPEGDLLLVGSGNLTFGGFGRNLEVLEVLEPNVAPLAFEDFAEFLSSLANREDFIAPDVSWTSTFANLAREAPRNQEGMPTEPQPRLIHSVERAVIDQIAELCAEQGGGQEAVILSPYHDLDGGTVRQFAERTGCASVAVALPADEGELSTFPFSAVGTWERPVRAVRPVVADRKRALHAKWIEVSLPAGRLTLTGSINATRKALCGVDNVEVGVLRVEPNRKTWAAWKDAAIPTNVASPDYRAAGLGNTCLVYASIRSDGVLAGHLIASNDLSGEWKGSLVRPDGETVQFPVTVNEQGQFTVPLPEIERFAFATGLQIVLSRGERTARGWVHQEEILGLPRLQRIGITTLIRLINREETEDDDIALLDYLAMSAGHHLSIFNRRIRSEISTGEVDGDKGERLVTVHLDEIAPSREVPTSGPGRLSMGVSGEEALNRIFAQIRRRLVGDKSAGHAAPATHPNPTNVMGKEEEDDEKELAARRQMENSLDNFDDSMRQLVDDLDSAEAQRAALVIWLEVKLHMLLRRLRDRAGGVAFLKEWFWKVCSAPRAAIETDALEQHVFTAAALYPALSVVETDDRMLLPRLHEALERFCGGDVDQTRAIVAVLSERQVGFNERLLDSKLVDLKENLRQVLATTTLRHEMVEIMNAYREGKPLPETSPVFDGPLGPELRVALSRPPQRPMVKAQLDERPICAHCYTGFTPDGEKDLRHRRVARCDLRCGKLTVRLKP